MMSPVDPEDGQHVQLDPLPIAIRSLASKLRRERARVGHPGYHLERHKKILAEFQAAFARLPLRIRRAARAQNPSNRKISIDSVTILR